MLIRILVAMLGLGDRRSAGYERETGDDLAGWMPSPTGWS